ncbi:MAG: hypothetical protein ACRD88_09765 [Terriglobia bacterium]
MWTKWVIFAVALPLAVGGEPAESQILCASIGGTAKDSAKAVVSGAESSLLTRSQIISTNATTTGGSPPVTAIVGNQVIARVVGERRHVLNLRRLVAFLAVELDPATARMRWVTDKEEVHHDE